MSHRSGSRDPPYAALTDAAARKISEARPPKQSTPTTTRKSSTDTAKKREPSPLTSEDEDAEDMYHKVLHKLASEAAKTEGRDTTKSSRRETAEKRSTTWKTKGTK